MNRNNNNNNKKNRILVVATRKWLLPHPPMATPERHMTTQRVVPVGTGGTRKIRLCSLFSVTLSEKSIFRESSRIPFFPQYGGDPPTKNLHSHTIIRLIRFMTTLKVCLVTRNGGRYEMEVSCLYYTAGLRFSFMGCILLFGVLF